VDDALALFAQALQSGFADLQVIEQDLNEDMKPIRDNPRFCKLLELARELHAAAAEKRAPEQ